MNSRQWRQTLEYIGLAWLGLLMIWIRYRTTPKFLPRPGIGGLIWYAVVFTGLCKLSLLPRPPRKAGHGGNASSEVSLSCGHR